MNNKQNKQDPNKIKKCNCEDKYGPRPFNANSNKVNKQKTN